ncbi:MAG: hypothetical protein WAV95_07150 [Azonexus sp.]
MSVDVNDHIQSLLSGCNRIVITAATPFDPRKKKSNDVLADIRDSGSIGLAKNVFLVDINSFKGSWMSPVDVYVGFLSGKRLIGSVGVVLWGLLRSPDWECDYAVKSHHELLGWLLDHGVVGSPQEPQFPF